MVVTFPISSLTKVRGHVVTFDLLTSHCRHETGKCSEFVLSPLLFRSQCVIREEAHAGMCCGMMFTPVIFFLFKHATTSLAKNSPQAQNSGEELDAYIFGRVWLYFSECLILNCPDARGTFFCSCFLFFVCFAQSTFDIHH